MIEICHHNNCTGCSACVNNCPKGAIAFNQDEFGTYYPVINQRACVKCMACIRVCPSRNEVSRSYPLRAFIGCAIEEKEHNSSTSGGIASVLCRFIIREDGVVYGCSSENPFNIHHIRVRGEDAIDKIKGSKYVQSSIGGIYNVVKKDLGKGLKVLFIGTPCQVAGLKSFLKKEYENLYTIDFVCHGVPSQKLFNDSLSLLKIKSDCKCAVKFRFKNKKGRSFYGLQVYDDKGKCMVQEKYPSNLYMLGFLKGVFYRDSCYECKYACPERVSDITLGDYADKDCRYSKELAVVGALSKILVNTSRGNELIIRCKSFLNISPISINELIVCGGQLVRPMSKHKQYDLFKHIYSSKGPKAAFNTIIRPMVLRARLSIFINTMSRSIYKIPYTKQLYSAVKKKL